MTPPGIDLQREDLTIMTRNMAVAVAASLTLLGGTARAQFDVDSNRNEVRARISEGGWEIVWGELVNEAEYAKMIASIAARGSAPDGPGIALVGVPLPKGVGFCPPRRGVLW